jgi:hypothetical protein
MALAVVAACGALPAPAVARVRPSDAAATHVYLEAVLAERRATASTGAAQLKAIQSLAAQVKSECPGVLAGVPPRGKGEPLDQATAEIDDEVLSASFGAAERVVHPALAALAGKVRRLRWSNPRLTRLLRSLAREASEQSAIPAPALCADLKSWVASGYTKLSAGTIAYAKRRQMVSSITQIEVEPNEPATDIFNLSALIRHRLKPYEDHRDATLARKAFPPQPSPGDPRSKPLFEALGSVSAALGRP